MRKATCALGYDSDSDSDSNSDPILNTERIATIQPWEDPARHV